MKVIKFKSDEILPILERVTSIVSQKNVMSSLLNVRIDARNDEDSPYLYLTTSDGEIWLGMKAPCVEISDKMTLFIDAKSMTQSLKSLGGMEVEMRIDEETLIATFHYANGRFKLPVSTMCEFPMPVYEEKDVTNSYPIPSSRLLTSLRKVLFAAANDTIRLVLNGVHFDFLVDGVTSVATDGQKLVKYKDKTLRYEGEAMSFTLPSKVCNALIGILPLFEGEYIELCATSTHILIRCDVFGVFVRPIEGKYPNYEYVIPKANDKECVVAREAICKALNRVFPFGNDSNKLVALSFKEGVIRVSAENVDYNKSANEDVVAVNNFVDDTFSIGFNGANLLQLISNTNGDDAKLLMLDATHAIIVKEANESDDVEYTSILMPMLLH